MFDLTAFPGVAYHSLAPYVGYLTVPFRSLKGSLPTRALPVSKTQKVTIVSLTLSVALLAVLSKYLRRRRGPYNFPTREARRLLGKRNRASIIRNQTDVLSQAGSVRRSDSPSVRSTHGGSAVGVSDRMSLASGSLASGGGTMAIDSDTTAQLAPQQLGLMGLETLENTITFWEDALEVYRTTVNPTGDGDGPSVLLSAEDAAFCRDLRNLLNIAYQLQENSELLFLDERSVLFRSESSARRKPNVLDSNMSSADSFASAQDMVADLREFEEFTDQFPDVNALPLYQLASRQLEEHGIPCRTLRTELVKCGSDSEFLAKLHCIRLAFMYIFRDANNWAWFDSNGKQILANLLLYADKDTKGFLIGYENMMYYLKDSSKWDDIEDELRSKGVKAFTFYDVVLDYILMDAFEDLESPPSTVSAVIQNRWLSDGFKETALVTAVWSILKAKRRCLKYPTGFMSHFYTISEQLSPLMAWGFLGPDESLREICVFFKDRVMQLLTDMFSFERTRYTTIEELSCDILAHSHAVVEDVGKKMEPHLGKYGLND